MKKRPLGQNFLIDEEVADEIVAQAAISNDDCVVEIGPGKGVLTHRLAEQAGRLIAVEIDPKLYGPISKEFSSREHVEFILADAMKFDFGSLPHPFKVVSNLPYYAATHILKRLIGYRAHVQDMTLMLQKEVIDRFSAEPGSKEYGSLTVYLQYYCDVERVLEVGKNAFSPPPKVDSSVVKITPLPKPRVQTLDEKIFFKVVHAAFFHKRKMLKNNFKLWSKLFKEEKGSTFLDDIDLSRRGETLSLQEFADLTNFLCQAHEEFSE